MFDTSGRTVYCQLSQSFGRTYDSLRGRMHAAGDEHPPMDSAAIEQFAMRVSTIDGGLLTHAREQINRFRGMSLPDVPWHRMTVGSTDRPANQAPSLDLPDAYPQQSKVCA